MATVNGVEVILDVPAKIINRRTMVPIRFFSEALGALVSWDNSTRTVYIVSDFDPTGKVKAKVSRVVDGDTINIIINGEEEGVRLLLVDTPETVHPLRIGWYPLYLA